MNTITLTAILGWPIFGLLIYASQKDPKRGAILSILIGFLFLPSGVGFDLPGLPAIDRDNIVALTLLGALLFGGKVKMPLKVGVGFYMLAILIYIVSPVLTAMTNGDSLVVGERVLRGMQAYDGLSIAFGELLELAPLFIGYWLITSVRDQRMMLTMIVVAGLCYSLLLIVEIRLSPQIHKWVYGFHPATEIGSARGDYYRPKAFLTNGLIAAFFTLTVVIAAVAIWRDDRIRMMQGMDRLARLKPRWFGFAAVYLTMILVISQSLGALVFGLAVIPAMIMLKPRTQLWVAVIITTIAFSYPILRSLDLVPHESLVEGAAAISERRAESLEARFYNEGRLLERGLERPMLGWGNWGRNRIYDSRGVDRTLSDGYWVIILGTRGIIGYLANYIVFVAPIYLFWLQSRRQKKMEVSPITAGICLTLSVNFLDFVPNAPLTPLTWLFIGALLRHIKENATVTAEAAAPVSAAAPPRRRTVL